MLQPFHQKVFGTCLIVFVFQLVDLLPPFIFREIIDRSAELTSDGSPNLLGFSIEKMSMLELVVLLITGWLCVNCINAIIHMILDDHILDLVTKIEQFIREQAHQKLLSLDLGFHEHENTGKRVGKIIRGADRIVDLVVTLSYDFMPTFIQVLLSGAIIFIIDPIVGIIFVPFVLLFLGLMRHSKLKTMKLRNARHDHYTKADGLFTQAMLNIHTVQTCSQEPAELGRHTHEWNSATRIAVTEFGIHHRFGLMQNFVNNLGRASVLLYSMFAIRSGNITLGTAILFLNFSERAFSSLGRFNHLSDRFVDATSAIERLQTIFGAESKVQDAPQAFDLPPMKGSIAFDRVTFAYNGSGAALRQVSLNIRAGETIAFVGPSGGGKTTLIKLLLRHVDPQEGTIRVDGIPLTDITRSSLRRQCGVVPQHVQIFNGTLRENVAYAAPLASDEEVWKALTAAQLRGFVEQLHDGLDTMVGERGLTLSGGQCQRIGIARAVLSNPQILIFDEATSHLDSKSERMIQHALEQIRRNRTTILIAHRLSTIQKADRIFVIDKGAIVETGTHTELIRSPKGLYRQLLEIQSEGALVPA